MDQTRPLPSPRPTTHQTHEVMDRISLDVGPRSPVTLLKLFTVCTLAPAPLSRRASPGARQFVCWPSPSMAGHDSSRANSAVDSSKTIASVWSFSVLCCFGPSPTVRPSNGIGRHASRRVNCTGGVVSFPKMNEPILQRGALDPSPSHLYPEKVRGRRR